VRLDSHQHFWRYDPTHHAWMTDQMGTLKRDYLPDELLPLLKAIAFDGCIAVQARQMAEETEWLLQLAGEHPFIRGVVGWVDLLSPTVRGQLKKMAANPKLVGVRHVLQDEPDDRFMLRPEFLRGIGRLAEHELAYDLLIFPRHLPVAVDLVRRFPLQKFVLDHIAKPPIREGLLSPWQEDLRRLADHPNVACKLSGMVTEAAWKSWRPEDLQRYLDVVVGAFGTSRVMIGSDWPVCTLSGDYASTMNVVLDYVGRFPAPVQEQILGATCARFYALASRAGET
jgi:L-fuconolactonase